ncbi:MAG: FAD:protein FMN transferase [Psychroflexus sp.]|nr:FAD:protein FMN transferase [Psychroflexus sp.]MDN6310769.1 FAD:protein FMN transferase [Psychroflexus sp.]
MKSKTIGYTFIIILIAIGAIVIYKLPQLNSSKKPIEFHNFKGKVYGTYFSMDYESAETYNQEIDSIFKAIDKASSAYSSASEISRLNRDKLIENASPLLIEHFEKAGEFYTFTDEYFDPTLSALIEIWGFGKNTQPTVDTASVKKHLSRVGFDEAYEIKEKDIALLKDSVKINFTAMGEGFAIDEIADFFESKSIQNYKVEIGGEMRTRGESPRSKKWLIGLQNPAAEDDPSLDPLMAKLELVDQALSTSGSYRKFFVDQNGIKRGHIINPKTGFPVKHELISVSVFSKSASLSDATATALMAMGLEKAKTFLTEQERVEAFLIYETEDGLKSWSTPGFVT